MIGIYKITNNINNNCYIGQSIHIEERWKKHKYLVLSKLEKYHSVNLYRLSPLLESRIAIDTQFKKVDSMMAVNTLAREKK